MTQHFGASALSFCGGNTTMHCVCIVVALPVTVNYVKILSHSNVLW